MISDRWTLNHHVISQPLVVSMTQAFLRELPYLTVVCLFNGSLLFLTLRWVPRRCQSLMKSSEIMP